MRAITTPTAAATVSTPAPPTCSPTELTGGERIASAVITPTGPEYAAAVEAGGVRAMLDLSLPTVTVSLDDGRTCPLFSYYPDEISFTAPEFVGRTIDEALALRHQRDVAYLRS